MLPQPTKRCPFGSVCKPPWLVARCTGCRCTNARTTRAVFAFRSTVSSSARDARFTFAPFVPLSNNVMFPLGARRTSCCPMNRAPRFILKVLRLPPRVQSTLPVVASTSYAAFVSRPEMSQAPFVSRSTGPHPLVADRNGRSLTASVPLGGGAGIARTMRSSWFVLGLPDCV